MAAARSHHSSAGVRCTGMTVRCTAIQVFDAPAAPVVPGMTAVVFTRAVVEAREAADTVGRNAEPKVTQSSNAAHIDCKTGRAEPLFAYSFPLDVQNRDTRRCDQGGRRVFDRCRHRGPCAT